MIVLFWDIDGTLLTTGRAGVFAWNDAVLELTGQEFDLKTAVRIPGLTDHQLAQRSLELLGIPADASLVSRLVRRYEELLPGSLPRKQGRVLDNVRPILEHLRAHRRDALSFLLTGNTRAGGRAKLAHYEILEFFPHGAFSEDTGPRPGIAARALALARESGATDGTPLLVIGDTPHDVDCANAIGAQALAVATGGYGLEELRAHSPWRLLARLPPPEEFARLIDAVGTAEPEARLL